MLRSRGRVVYTIARLEKVWSCVDPMECATVIYCTTTSECKSGPLPVAGGGRPNPPNPPGYRHELVTQYSSTMYIGIAMVYPH